MDELLEDIAIEKERIEQSLVALRLTLVQNELSLADFAAVANCLNGVYNGMENLLKCILKFMKVSPPDARSFDQDLIDLAFEHKLVSQELAEALDEYRAFRRFFADGDGAALREAPLQPLSQNLSALWLRFQAEIETFVEALQGPKTV